MKRITKRTGQKKNKVDEQCSLYWLTSAEVTHLGEYIEVATPFIPGVTPELITKFKSNVPSADRYWNPKDKVWGFKASYMATIIKILDSMSYRYTITNDPRKTTEREGRKVTRDLLNQARSKLKSELKVEELTF